MSVTLNYFLAVFSNIAIVYKQIFHQVLYQRIMHDWHTEVTSNMGMIINGEGAIACFTSH